MRSVDDIIFTIISASLFPFVGYLGYGTHNNVGDAMLEVF